MRQYIRHPLEVAIEIRIDTNVRKSVDTRDIGLGGLAIHSDVPVAAGAMIAVRIAYVDPVFEALARVAWCRPRRGGVGHEVGVSFLDADDVFRARMVEQVCHIEDYRRLVARAEGRLLGSEEAAGEWIAKYAAKFPGAGNGGLQ